MIDLKNKVAKMFRAPITWVILLGLLLRLPGLKYGLPLWLVGDEPPLILTALKMLQLKTLLPVLHLGDFKPFLYYPPYLAYLYLPFFAAAVGLKIIMSGASLNLLPNLIVSDTSTFFIIARSINIFFALVSIFLIYRITDSLFKKSISACAAAFLVGTSVLHIMLSFTARHWIAVFLSLVVALYFLTREKLSFNRRYLFATLAVGVSIGMSTIGAVGAVLIVLWYVLVDKRSVVSVFREKIFYWCVGTLIVSFVLPVILYPASLGFAPDTTVHESKTMIGALVSPILFMKPIVISEPVLVLLFLIGLIALVKSQRRLIIVFLVFIYVYSLLFYFLFRFEHRFLLPLVLVFAVIGGYGFDILYEALRRRHLGFIALTVIAFPLFLSLQVSYLALRNDSRILAENYLETNIPNGAKVIVYANLMRLRTTKEAIDEQANIDPGSLRTVDRAESELLDVYRKGPIFHALNLYTVRNPEFYNNLSDYADRNDYRYLIASTKDFLNNQAQTDQVLGLRAKGRLLAAFGTEESAYSVAESDLSGNPLTLFTLPEFGPRIEIYELTK